ncbi:MAG TPA: cell envelope integrity protein TolA [Verrucomicrobiae bacterium]
MKRLLANGSRLATKAGCGLSLVFLGVNGCTTYVDQPRHREVVYQPAPAPREVYVPPPRFEPPPVAPSYVEMEIRAESDFYEPLRPYGRWEVVGTYGRCWVPTRVENDWRPYSNGHWQRTEAGWYWASEEPWGWATYHYGRWDFSPQLGWYWLPQTQWAPAWVSWHEGGGYVGWAPLHPSARVSVRGSVEVNVAVIAPRAYVFVEPRHFLEPVRPSTVVVNNTTIINKTVNITNIKVVNKNVINEGPRTTIIEQASGQRVQPVAVRELRRNDEAPMAARRRAAPNISGTAVPASAPRVNETVERNVPIERERRAQEIDRNVQTAPQREAEELQRKAQLEFERRQKEAQRAAELGRKEQLETERRARQAESARNAGEAQRKAQAESERRQRDEQRAANELARKNQLEAQRQVQEAAQQNRQAELRAKELEWRAPGAVTPPNQAFETKAPIQPDRPGKGKKGGKDAKDKGPTKKLEPTPPEAPVEPPPLKN